MQKFNLASVLLVVVAPLICWAQAQLEPPQGGKFQYNLRSEPVSLHPWLFKDAAAKTALSYMGDSLLARDLATLEWRPRLAHRWEVSSDGRVFTFHLRKNAFFHDGKEVTAEDVKFTFESIVGLGSSSPLKSILQNIARLEVVDTYTLRVYTKDSYYLNFIAIAEMLVAPRHFYDSEDKSRFADEYVGAGPYKFVRFQRGRRLVLKRFDKWYGNSQDWKGFYNFETLEFRFLVNETAIMDSFRKSELDFSEVRLETFQKAQQALADSALAVRIENKSARPYSFVGWNQSREIFKDRSVRLALAHLMDHERLLKQLNLSDKILNAGPHHPSSDFAVAEVKPIKYDQKKARELLKKSGWKDTDKNGILDKSIDGKKTEFKFTLLHASKESEKYWQFYKTELQKVGIHMSVQELDWPSFLKRLEANDFDALAMALSGALDWDPGPVWHSDSVQPGGFNFIGYRNSRVDHLIETARSEIDRSKRVKTLRKVYELIAQDVPCIWLFSDPYSYYLRSKRVAGAKEGSMKYDIGLESWHLAAE